MYSDRKEAGERLAEELLKRNYESPIVMGVPRGGVPVAYRVAMALDAPLDIVVPRKIGAPGNPEYAIGAVTEEGSIVLNEAAVRRTGASDEYVENAAKEEREEIERRIEEYRGKMEPVDLKGSTVLLVDDGVATGTTLKAAINSVRKRGPTHIVVAVPVGAPSSVEDLRGLADEVICLETPKAFGAVGQYYRSFPQTSDEEVKNLLQKFESE